jgi:predicted NBD/HSP70 family sugar kinase
VTLGLELSLAHVRGVSVTGDGAVTARRERSAAAGGLARAAREVVARLAGGRGQRPGALGLAVHAIDADQLAAVRETLAPVSPVVVRAGEAAVLAESWCGAGVGVRTLAVITLVAHVAGGLLVEGQPWRGARGYAGALGWLALNPVEREDYRRHGGLEAEVGAAGLVHRLVWRVKSGDHSSVVDEVGGDLTRLTPEHILKGARAGDGVSVSVVRDTARYLAMAVSNISAIVDPEAIVLGGRIASNADLLLEGIREDCLRRLAPQQAATLDLRLSPLGDDGVAVGAARVAMQAST